jgi:hypothetical protein
VTRYAGDVVRSVATFRDGVRDGRETSYWDNGRVRSVTTWVRGTKGECGSFPKFDRPVPVVLLEVAADEKLYAAWNHVAVDDFPRVLDLDVVRRRLMVPDFLREVAERNRAGTLKSDYEDASRFDDSIAYFLTVDPHGEVTDVQTSGGGVYSVAAWAVYPPLLRDLRFAPGTVRGRPVKCRVLAKVRHTFAEGEAPGPGATRADVVPVGPPVAQEERA